MFQTDTFKDTYLVERTERIVAALLLVSDTIAATHPYSQRLQSHALELLAAVHHREPGEKALRRALDHAVSLTRTAYYAGLVSRMNYEVVCREIEKHGHDLDAQAHRDAGDIDASSLFALPQQEQRGSPSAVRLSQASQRHMNVVHREQGQFTQGGSGQLYRSNMEHGQDTKGHAHEQYSDTKKDRRASILSILQRKDRITVKDVSSVITDCSEKTLQRELLALVAQGVLKKEGEKRWSTYSLV